MSNLTIHQSSHLMKANSLALVVAITLLLAACGNSGGDAPAAGEAAGQRSEERHAEGTEEGEGHGHEEEGDHGEEEDEEGHGGAEHVPLTPEQLKAGQIGVAQAGPAEIRQTLPLYGVITPNAERVREVTARFPGVIRTVAKRVGDSVRQGETLATVESDESLQTYGVLSPLSGVVTRRNANPGEHAGEEALFTVADLSSVWVELSLFPRDVSKVRVGQSVRVRSADTDQSSVGKVVYVSPFGSASNQTLTARVLLDNAQGQWPPGLYVTADVTLATTTVQLSIRSEALQTLEERVVVFVQDEKGFEARPVQVGRSDGEVTEVLAGLEAGESYATKNSFVLKAELGKGEAEHGH